MTRHDLLRRISSEIRVAPLNDEGEIDALGEIRIHSSLVADCSAARLLKGAKRRAASINNSKGSQQIMAPKADHFFNNQQAKLVRYVRDFLDKSF